MTIRILTICTGNVCRSPLAAQLLASRLDAGLFDIDSAGTAALIGDRMPDPAQHIAARLGVRSAAEHRAVALTPEAVSTADLILGMERSHRRMAAQLHPSAVRRAFTLLEFAHIVSEISDDRLLSMGRDALDLETRALDTVTRMRGAVARMAPDLLYDVEDPYGRSVKVYERSARQVEHAVAQVVEFFRRISELSDLELDTQTR